jgi:hypothetical protein
MGFGEKPSGFANWDLNLGKPRVLGAIPKLKDILLSGQNGTKTIDSGISLLLTLKHLFNGKTLLVNISAFSCWNTSNPLQQTLFIINFSVWAQHCFVVTAHGNTDSERIVEAYKRCRLCISYF